MACSNLGGFNQCAQGLEGVEDGGNLCGAFLRLATETGGEGVGILADSGQQLADALPASCDPAAASVARVQQFFARRQGLPDPHPFQGGVQIGSPESNRPPDFEVRDQAGHTPAVEVAFADVEVAPKNTAVVAGIVPQNIPCIDPEPVQRYPHRYGNRNRFTQISDRHPKGCPR